MTSAPSCTQRKKWTENETLKFVNFHLSRRSRQSSASGYQPVRANESVRLNQEQAKSCMNTQRASTAQEEVTGKSGNCPLSRVLGLY